MTITMSVMRTAERRSIISVMGVELERLKLSQVEGKDPV